MKKDSLGDRMKQNYEDAFRINLPRRMPVIIRVDGKSFHTFTKVLKAEKPFCEKLYESMKMAAWGLVQEIQGAEFAYFQSDEISVFLKNYSSFESEPWFGNNLQKMVSVAASIATAYFNRYTKCDRDAFFDARVFVLPKEEVLNYFLWRQQDALRNSVQSKGIFRLGHAACQNKNCEEIKNLLRETDFSWEDVCPKFRYGSLISRGDLELPGGCEYVPNFREFDWIEYITNKVDECEK